MLFINSVEALPYLKQVAADMAVAVELRLYVKHKTFKILHTFRVGEVIGLLRAQPKERLDTLLRFEFDWRHEYVEFGGAGADLLSEIYLKDEPRLIKLRAHAEDMYRRFYKERFFKRKPAAEPPRK